MTAEVKAIGYAWALSLMISITICSFRFIADCRVFVNKTEARAEVGWFSSELEAKKAC